MKTIAEQISAFESKRTASVARQTEIQQKAIDESRSKDAAEKEEFDTLAAEIKAIDDELADLKVLEKQAVSQAAAVAGSDPDEAARSRGVTKGVEVPNGRVTVKSNLAPGVRFARYAQAMIRAQGNISDALQIVQNEKAWVETKDEIIRFIKAAVPAGDTTTSGWASQLAYQNNLASEFVEYLRPMTILGKLSLRRVPFNIRVGEQNGTGTGNWVGQGVPIPVSKQGFTSQTLGIAKAACITPVDEELARLSSPSAELLVRDDLAKVISTFLDVQFVDPNVSASANVSPASITNGVTPTDATGTTAATLRTDTTTLMKTMADNNLDVSKCAWIMTPSQAMDIEAMLNSLGLPLYPETNASGGTFRGLPVITSNSANIPGSPNSGKMIILVNQPEIFLADDDQIQIDVSREASLQLLDNPTNTSTGSTTATTMVSMFQTMSLAIRAVRFINWAKRRTTAVAYIKEAAYVA